VFDARCRACPPSCRRPTPQSRSTTKAEMPRWPALLVGLCVDRVVVGVAAVVMKHLEPLMTYLFALPDGRRAHARDV